MKILKNHGLDTDNRTYIIAEIGINHGGNLDTAKRLIDSAASTGCNAVKFQTYLTEKRVSKDKEDIFNILKASELPLDSFSILKKHADEQGITFFSTPFDKESLDYLESIDTPLYKVASFDVVNRALLDALSKTGKPIIMSVGMADINEIKEAYFILKKNNNSISLLHCISAYPTQEIEANLDVIHSLRHEFPQSVIGQSDHTSGIKVPLYAIAAGAQIIEKHYKIDSDMDCVDAPVSITEKQMRVLVEEARLLEEILGDSKICSTQAEQGTRAFRRIS